MDYNQSNIPQKHKNITKNNNNNQNYKKFKSFSNNNNKHHHRNRERGDAKNYKLSQDEQQNYSKGNREIQEKFQWDFDELAIHYPPLNDYVFINERGRTTIDWTNTAAHKTLNQAILAVQFKIVYWDMPQDQLIPTIPSRLNYLEWIHNKLQSLKINNEQSNQIKAIDIGTGASVIYPILGASKYNWSFIATELSDASYQNAKKIINNNPQLKNKVELRKSQGNIFKDIIQKSDGDISFTMCNPPFFSEHEEKQIWVNAQMKENEYICEGGELQFLKQMFEESKIFANQIKIFTSLVGKQTNFEQFLQYLKQQNIQNLNENHDDNKEISKPQMNKNGEDELNEYNNQNIERRQISFNYQSEFQNAKNDDKIQNDISVQNCQGEEFKNIQPQIQSQQAKIEQQDSQEINQKGISNSQKDITKKCQNKQVSVQIFEGSIVQGNTTRWIVGWRFE
ncbi:ribosomal RNA large subunit methyltransferase F, putative (macronuclear) [Tetrahymena thermophila SB210]|uniref:U6 small nuclear RNA (adenine-(43)-N(6))-methyltransferase n=1 Tax=Tetrahymena thermophila (strain SB210) TaxID=312017 RepID=Q231G1_TETTS|nr:ribosomal RNA large subunit methyltransferase F, putative [Tetrahymena thermophila SB210]EAR91078.1 ribosomal RNA large subunit methyltransferase F, putative [Tetrahymena thermophila SB210]|eukprot:XP_001011323.1 ribosomal RNA large subunit methyltransferase F, putative [Tetrahymena thermophila SB210]